MRNTCLVGNCFIERLDERQSEATETGASAGATANCSSEAPWWADLTPNMKFSFQLKLLAACSRQAWGTRSWPLRWDTPSIPVMKLPRWHIQPPPALIFHFSHTPLSTTHPPLFNSPLKPLNGSRDSNGRWTHHRWPQAQSRFLGGGRAHRKQLVDIFTQPPLPFLSPPPPLHPLSWGMCSRCDSSNNVQQAPVSCPYASVPSSADPR